MRPEFEPPSSGLTDASGDLSICERAREELQNTVLVIKTGATESRRKVPVHSQTTLRCWPNVLFLSDFDESIGGHQVHDALDHVSEQIRLEHPSFELWRRLHAHGRSAIEISDSETGDNVYWESGTTDMQAGWHLARFMNLAMSVKALEFHPDARWFVFIDADTYISWSGFLGLARTLDHTKPLYVGYPAAMGPNMFFGHGGSGYALSQAALTQVVESYQAQQSRWDTDAVENEFGEVPFAKLLLSIGIDLSWALPHFQRGDPASMDFSMMEHGRRAWCYPAVTYHHVGPDDIRRLHRFEGAWNRTSDGRHFRHSDVYRSMGLPIAMKGDADGWDNLSEHVVEGVDDYASCREACRERQTCVQYSFNLGQCRTSSALKRGRATEGAASGWVVDRVHRMMESLDTRCHGKFLI
ncbi:hypothetical protein CLAFUW4_12478 [Fulvia fulva]|uniref:N-acetylgalactosaminide beta-1,3-galactosyltransferase n=1 Tax=Passalora fulva TaxID=5499 RepID=A0A9Q8USN7_PASFU|nr:uncharacterized protein CLAFUR5_11505 [Fulvia fulva]KAK4617427.1 hypothetical protein CLAFUR4_12483 [Fulvia fulva]KAK4619111.1 hypothetical protein CLAFUR0_12494 [Fulvia fulva]UJO20981.1 hypothetical protein CLAFUR5_11505 [Fulvia fulva]WPV18417.1 hypothetical protein CLAFUW4_12478 [Fulvia fulva]WPV33121.1 hypothetical protein CLAFUW7_12485 [Fulvia fulva]